MRFIKFRFRKVDFLLIPLVAILMYFWQSYDIKQSSKKRLDEILKKCRQEQALPISEQKSCQQYSQELYGQ